MVSLMLVLIFGSFGLASGLFQDTSTRQGSEMQLRAIKLLLQHDLELSDFWLTNKLKRPLIGEGNRDALSTANLSDWNDNTKFDPSNDRPQWDRYVVWYATQEPTATLYRQVVEPGGVLTVANGNLSTSNLSDLDPNSNANVIFSRRLSERVKDFNVNDRYENGTVTIRVHLQTDGLKRQNTMGKTQDNLELELTFQPRNTFPRI